MLLYESDHSVSLAPFLTPSCPQRLCKACTAVRGHAAARIPYAISYATVVNAYANLTPVLVQLLRCPRVTKNGTRFDLMPHVHAWACMCACISAFPVCVHARLHIVVCVCACLFMSAYCWRLVTAELMILLCHRLVELRDGICQCRRLRKHFVLFHPNLAH
jgi:hypothetical protein